MVLLDDEALAIAASRCAAGAAAASRSSSARAAASATSSRARRDRVRQPVHLRRGRLELRAVRAVGGVRPRAAAQAAGLPRAPRAQLRALREHLARYPDVFVLPRTTAGLDTAWHMFPIQIRPASGVRRGALQQWMEARGVDTRMVWSGNILRQPGFAKIAHRAPRAACRTPTA
jgi:hypothetical protein